VVFESTAGGAERVGLLHLAAVRVASSGGATVNSHRLTYVDFQSGEYVETYDAGQEVARFFEKIWGRTVSAAEVRSLAALPGTKAPGADRHQWMGDFEILGELGRGAMGIVYRARQGSLGRTVALKVLPGSAATDAVAARRFQLEVEALGRCDHPNVVKVLTAGRDGDSQYYAMELVEGSDLARVYSVLNGWHRSHPGHLTEGHLVGAITSSGTRVTGNESAPPQSNGGSAAQIDHAEFRKLTAGKDYYKRLAEIMADAARGVQHLHDHHLLHRDIKPANLMLSRDGQRAIVMDLGLAKATDSASLPGSSQVTVLGTLRYMAPEQLQRKLIELTPQADVYSLGATLYELACLAPIFDADTEGRLTAQVLFEEPVNPKKRNPELPDALALIIEKATAKVPTRRYETAAQMAEDLDSFARDGFTIHAKPPSPLQVARKYARSHRTGSLVGTAALVVVVGGLSLWDFNRLKTNEYANVVDVRQVPVGVGRLSSSLVKRMTYHVELQYKRGKVLVERVVNSAGSLDGEADECEWHYHYRQDGSLDSTEALDHNRIVRRVVVTSADGRIIEFKDKGGATMNERSESGRALTGASEITRNFVEYNKAGRPVKVFFQNSYGRPKADNNGSFGNQYEYNAAGFKIKAWDLDINGQKKLSANGVFETRYERDKWGYPTKECYFGPTGEPAIGPRGYSCQETTRDDAGRVIQFWDLGPNGNRVVAKDGYAGQHLTYSERGFRTETECQDANGNPTPEKTGVAILRTTFDQKGDAVEYRFFGTDGKPTYSNQGISIHKAKVDAAGNPVEESYFGTNGQPVTDEHGHHRIVRTYTDGRETRFEQFGIDGQRVQTQAEMPIETYEYEQNGYETERRFFDEKGQPAANPAGVQRIQHIYDERGNLVDESFFDSKGNRVVNRNYGLASVKETYDSQGNMIEQEAFGPDQKPLMLPTGFQRRTYKYDEFGQRQEEAFFDAGGKPAMVQGIYHKAVMGYDGQGNLIEFAYYGADGLPASSPAGTHRVTRLYDRRGNMIEEAVFGKDGSPVLTRQGIHMSHWKYDEWGRRVEEAFFGVHGEPVLSHGYHFYRTKYDLQGHAVETAYFDNNDQPCVSEEGFHRMVSRYDERGYLVETSYFAADGSPGLFRGEFHRQVEIFDERGDSVENRSYDSAGNLTLASGRAVRRTKYDARGNELEVSYYGVHDEPVRRLDRVVDPTWTAQMKRRNGAAKVVYTYDTGNRLTLEEYFGPDNQRAEDVFGAARVVFIYAPDGRRVERWFRLSGAEIPAKLLEPPPE